jgi:hypothetical protein
MRKTHMVLTRSTDCMPTVHVANAVKSLSIVLFESRAKMPNWLERMSPSQLSATYTPSLIAMAFAAFDKDRR